MRVREKKSVDRRVDEIALLDRERKNDTAVPKECGWRSMYK